MPRFTDRDARNSVEGNNQNRIRRNARGVPDYMTEAPEGYNPRATNPMPNMGNDTYYGAPPPHASQSNFARKMGDAMRNPFNKGTSIAGMFRGTLAGELITTASNWSGATQTLNMAQGAINNAVSQFWSPKMQQTNVAAVNANYPTYQIGGYGIDLVVNLPAPKDIVAFDNYLTQNGVAVNDYEVPVFRNEYQFNFIQTLDAVVKSGVRMAAVQMQQLLNNGCRWWNSKGEISPADLNINRKAYEVK